MIGVHWRVALPTTPEKGSLSAKSVTDPTPSNTIRSGVSVDNWGKIRTASEYINVNGVKSLSPDGKLLMGYRGPITFWDAAIGARVRDFPTPGGGEVVQWLDDRRVILDSTRGFLIIDVRTGALTRAPDLPDHLDHRMVIGVVPE